MEDGGGGAKTSEPRTERGADARGEQARAHACTTVRRIAGRSCSRLDQGVWGVDHRDGTNSLAVSNGLPAGTPVQTSLHRSGSPVVRELRVIRRSDHRDGQRVRGGGDPGGSAIESVEATLYIGEGVRDPECREGPRPARADQPRHPGERRPGERRPAQVPAPDGGQALISFRRAPLEDPADREPALIQPGEIVGGSVGRAHRARHLAEHRAPNRKMSENRWSGESSRVPPGGSKSASAVVRARSGRRPRTSGLYARSAPPPRDDVPFVTCST